MKNHCRHAAGLLRASAAGLSLSLGLVAMPAMAQNAGAEPDDSTIIVTATRRSEALSDVPIAVPAAVAAPQDAAPDADEMPDVGATSGAGTAPGAEPEAEPEIGRAHV